MTKEEMDELLVDPREELIRKLSSTGSVPDAEESFVDLLDLTTRTRCALIWAGITSYEQIKSMSMDELLEVKNLGSRGAIMNKNNLGKLDEIINKISEKLNELEAKDIVFAMYILQILDEYMKQD